jgi:hypothetical protein
MDTWQDVLPLIVRSIINDLDEDNPTYTDERLQQLILTSAQLIKPEIDFNLVYTISMANASITPDPVSNQDDGFINLVSMKTAVLILGGELKNLAAGSVRVSDASAQIDMTGAYTATKDLYDKLLKDYDKARIAYVLGNMNEIKAILTPYTVPYNVYPSVMFG